MKEEDKIYELISKQLTSDISKREKEMLDALLSQNPEIKSKYNLIENYWDNYFPTVKSNMAVKKAEKKLRFPGNSEKSINLSFLKIAVSVLLIVSFTYLSYHYFREKPQELLHEYYAATGEIKEVVLSDGTKVWLNSHSLLIASEPFVKATREVILLGEGYFEVAHNPQQPFIVKTHKLETKVLGTHFNISAYADDIDQTISLYEGSIELAGVKTMQKKVLVTPGEKVFYTNSDGEFKVIANHLESPAIWRDGVLRFYDEDFKSIAKFLERKFQTKIVFTDENVAKLHFTANFDEEPLLKILQLLKEAHNFEFREYDNSIIIRSKKI